MSKNWLKYLRWIIPWGAIAIAFFWIGTSWTNPALAASKALEYQCETQSCDPINKQPFFGDLHVHTSYSVDSYIFGNTNDPDAAYQFAKGKPITIKGKTVPITGKPLAVPINGAYRGEDCAPESINNPRGDSNLPVCHQISSPLDFTAVTDHAETMGEYHLCVADENSEIYNNDFCQGVRELDLEVYQEGFIGLSNTPPTRFDDCYQDGTDICREAAKTTWQEIQNTADKYNEPGKFTAFKAFEYSPNLDSGGMIHRNVIFKGEDVTEEVASVYEIYTDTRLWKWLEENCINDENTNCDVLDIPHNSNFSWGKTFGSTTTYNEKYTDEDIDRRINYETLAEIIQSKGASECAFGVGSTDEECSFEQFLDPCPEVCAEGTLSCAQEGSFVRNALKKGLLLEEETGKNPFKIGFIGSRDTHNGDPGGTEETTYPGHQANNEDTPEKRLFADSGMRGDGGIINSPGALAGIWAEENTRSSIFDALRRKETFGTSGTRLKVRLFGGWDYPDNLHEKQDRVILASSEGVPMGGDLTNAPVDEAPDFMVLAMQDPNSAPLQKVQIVKGWEAVEGTKEAVYDVVCSNGLTPDPSTHLCPFTPVTTPQSEDECKALLNSDKGASDLSYTWTDPDFDPSQRAFYYARVLESPTCRWSTYDAFYLDTDPDDLSVDSTIKERAWSSPIWYTPGTIPDWTLEDAIEADGPFTVQLFEQAGVEQLNDNQLKGLTVGKTLLQKNLFNNKQYPSLYTSKGKRIVATGLGTDRPDISNYEIHDNLRYETTLSGKQIGVSIYPVGDRYISCNPLDGGYCKWEVSQVTKK